MTSIDQHVMERDYHYMQLHSSTNTIKEVKWCGTLILSSLSTSLQRLLYDKTHESQKPLKRHLTTHFVFGFT